MLVYQRVTAAIIVRFYISKILQGAILLRTADFPLLGLATGGCCSGFEVGGPRAAQFI